MAGPPSAAKGTPLPAAPPASPTTQQQVIHSDGRLAAAGVQIARSPTPDPQVTRHFQVGTSHLSAIGITPSAATQQQVIHSSGRLAASDIRVTQKGTPTNG